MQKYIKILIIIIIFLAILAGAFYFFNQQIELAKKRSYQQGWDAAKTRLYEQIGPIMNEGALSNRLIGVVQNRNGNQIEIEVNSTQLLSDPELDKRTVTINEQTKIYLFRMKDSEQYQCELEAYYRENNIDPETFIPSPEEAFGPDLYEQVAVNSDSLKNGQTIDVYGNGNIADLKSFVAKEIVIKN